MTSPDDMEWVLNNPELGDLISEANAEIYDNNHRGEREMEEYLKLHPEGTYVVITKPGPDGEHITEIVWKAS